MGGLARLGRVIAAPLWALPGLILLFFYKMAFSNLILARGDMFLYFYPYWQATSEALRNGRIPLWNPHLFMGAPLLANSQMGFFYPPNWPLWLLFSVPVAVKVAILLHLLIAGVGAYLAGRRALGLEREAATVTAVLFALSAYLTAQVEHLNQLQGLAWLPWYLAALSLRQPARRICALSAFFSLQLLAGHTQTAFISGVGVALWLAAQAAQNKQWQVGKIVRHFAPLLLAAGLALLLTAVQLLPTLELARLSSRQGGLAVNEVLSFSLHPLLLGRALLPAYGQSLFSEYVAFFPVTVLLLAGLGAWRWRNRPGVLPALLLTAVGLFLALGVFNPVNWLLARLPGFNLFRVPARWLALYALGVALLAGAGWQWGVKGEGVKRKAPVHNWLSADSPFPIPYFLLMILLMAWSVLGQWLAPLLPTDVEAPYEAPGRLTLLLWAGELLFALVWLGRGRLVASAIGRGVYLTVATAVLFFATRTHSYHNLTAPEAYHDLRPPIARLLVARGESAVASRFLSLSPIFFDPGDQGEITAVYGDQLDAAALYDYIVVVKQKEIIAPNLPLAYGLMAVDGFDGGILPLRAYSDLMRLLLPPDTISVDGRLREYLTAVPPQRWLNLFNTRYLITDKTGDQWRNGVFYDLQHPLALAAGERAAIGYVPPFAATAIYLLADAAPTVTVTIGTYKQTAVAVYAAPGEPPLYRVPLGQTAVPQQIVLSTPDAPVHVSALALVNEVNGSFHTLVPGPYRLIHSGDVKIYENLAVLPRVLLLSEWQWQPDAPSALAVMRDPTFDPGKTAVLQGPPVNEEMRQLTIAIPPSSSPNHHSSGSAQIISYTPERVLIHTHSDAPTLLLLSDAHYPGWRATVDGQPVEIYTANVLFRALFVPPGTHEVTFVFAPTTLTVGGLLTLLGLLLWGAVLSRSAACGQSSAQYDETADHQ